MCGMVRDPDPSGQAALMLSEGLLLLLIERGIVHRDEALATIGGIVELKREMAGQSESVVVSLASINLLKAIARSVAAATEPTETSLIA